MRKLQYKSYVSDLTPYKPGKPIEEVKREMHIDEIVKMASNENAFGPSQKAIAAVRTYVDRMHFYPEGDCFYLRKKLAAHLRLSKDNLIFGNGSNEIIEFIVKGFLDLGKEILSSEYAFAVYPILTRAYGGVYTSVPMKDYRFDLNGLYNAITDKTSIIFIANPNNPTGTIVKRDDLELFIEKVPKHILICIDEAYFEFVNDENYPDASRYINNGNIVVLRTFSKIYGLAGLLFFRQF